MLRRFRSVLAAFALTAIAASAQAQSRLPAEGFADLAARLTPAVVNIATSQRVEGVDELPQFPRGSPLERFNNSGEAAQITSLGSGFIVSADGVVVTNNHVIAEADSIEVILQSGEHLVATVAGRDPATDIAVLRVQPRAPLPHVSFGDSDTARVGDIVLAIGNPFGLGGSLSVGVVSARNRNIDAGRYDDFIQTDAAINRGNSGGPLFNMAGDVIGVNTAIVSPTGNSVGVGFATPASIVRPVVEQILRFGETRRGWLGVRLANVSAETGQGLDLDHGAVVTRITPGGPAASAGLRTGDIVLKFDGRDVRDSHALTRMVGDATVGARVDLEIVRAGRRTTIAATIARLEEAGVGPARTDSQGEPTPPRRVDGGPRGGRIMGLALSELDAGLRQEFQIEPDVEGLVVLSSSDSDADRDPQFHAGDVILEMAFTRVNTIPAARAIAARAAIGQHAIVVKVDREGAVTYRRLRVTE